MGTLQVLGFRLGDQFYGFDVSNVYEVSRMVAVTELPDSPPEVLGVVNYRGNIIPVVDLRLRFGLAPRESGLNTPIIIAWSGEYACGLVVDEVSEVLSLEPGAVMSPEAFGQAAHHIAGVARLDDGLLLIVNPADIVTEETVRQVADAKD
ncbi:MAG: chemotaxis protein CheW [Deltaproteobacteria bacterium]|nr:chemotaxis protein CheW [Deltaproteobacteria bacterium]